MNFTNLRNKVAEFDNSQKVSNLKDYEIIALLYVDKLKEIESLQGKEFEFLFSDIIGKNCNTSYIIYLGTNSYISATQYAKNCIEIELRHTQLKPSQAPNWTRNALHCFDHLIIHYINDILQETVTQFGKWFKETFNYEHLISKGGDLADIGSNFKSIYQLRSEFEHIQYKNDAGKIQIRNLSNKKRKEKLGLIVQFFKAALEKFDLLYSKLPPR